MWKQRAQRLKQQYEQTIANRRDRILEFAQRQHEAYEATIQRARRAGLPVQIENKAGEVVATLEGFTENGLPLYVGAEADTSAALINTEPLWSHPWNLDGSQQRIGLWEYQERPLESHDEFGGSSFSRIEWRDDTTPSYGNHATHAAGIMIAEGAQQRAHGMAPEANLYAWDNADDLEEMSRASISPGITLSNHSYGLLVGWNCFGGVGPNCLGGTWRWWGDQFEDSDEDYKFGFYDDTAADWDDLAHKNPYYLAVKSAGNDRNDTPSSQPVTHEVLDAGDNWTTSQERRDEDCQPGGYDCVKGAAVSKNVLVVGALEDDGVTPADFSAFGPTDDGRIKPDLVANGVSVYSAEALDQQGNLDNSAYGSRNGTSMATPAVTGSIALLKDLLGTAEYHAATLKGLLLHTADDVNASTLPGPDYQVGWGRMNTEAAANVLEAEIAASEPLHVVDNMTLDGNETLEFEITTKASPEPLRVTVAWTDPPGFPPSAGVDRPDRMLLNDLDVRVIHDATGVVKEPYVLDPSNPSGSANAGDNEVDNVEQVYLPTPVPGETYTLRVSHEGPCRASRRTSH